MIRLATTTERPPDEVLGAALDYFGPSGLGLEVKVRTDAYASFEGGGGYVAIEARVADGGTEVTVNAREWESDARGFVGSL